MGLDVWGLDLSEEMIKQAKKNNDGEPFFIASTAAQIPFRDETFDFGYCINLLHHLGDWETRKGVLHEMRRVIGPGGRLFIHEINWDNLLFRIYMHYIFPLTNKIDRDHRQDTVSVRKFQDVDGWKFLGVKYFTFLPNITPRFAFLLLKGLEGILERSTGNRFGAHCMVSLERVG